MLRIARVIVLIAAVLAPAAAFGREKAVRLDVEGRVVPVRTYATTAPDLLRRVGIDPGERAMVVPSGPLEAGTVVTVRRAKPVQLIVGSDVRTVWVHGLTVGESLKELGMPAADADFVWPAPRSPVVDGMQLVVRDAVSVTVSIGGERRDVVSSAGTVAELLAEAGIRLGAKDRVTPARDTYPGQGSTITVVRVRETIRAEEVPIPFGQRQEKDAGLEKGRRKVARAGRDGLKLRRYAAVVQDGKVVSKRFLDEKVVRKPVDQVVKVGTGQPSFRAKSGRSEQGIASWYRFDGMGAAHRTLPFGTVVRVTNLANGRTVNVVIRDRGPFVEGRIIDLSDSAFAELAPLSSGTIRVRIEW